MPLVLNAAVGDAGANSYVDLTYANAYFESRVGSSTWEDADDVDTKVPCLVHATRILDASYDWNGWRATDAQALRWPRRLAPDLDEPYGSSDVYDMGGALESYIDDTIVPVPVKNATCELAFELMTTGSYSANPNEVDQVRVGPVSVRFSGRTPTYSLPNAVIEMLRYYGSFRGFASGSSITTVPVFRT